MWLTVALILYLLLCYVKFTLSSLLCAYSRTAISLTRFIYIYPTASRLHDICHSRREIMMRLSVAARNFHFIFN